MTVTVQAGVRLDDLQARLAGANQFLPLDPPQREATIGGILASNASGSWRLGFGTARDLTLGMRMALADGTLIVYGGKVMKNVAGFDLAKLFIGSLGTLGVIGEATLRTFAEPEVRQTLVVSGLSRPEAVAGLAQRFLDSNTRGLTVAEADSFYGYYTLDILRDGLPVGMLSVNGYTQQVFLHTWHGNFIEISED